MALPSLRGADFSGLRIASADLGDLDLSHCRFHGTDLYHCAFHDTDLAHSDLTGARLYAAELRGTSLSGCSLKSAVLGWTVFAMTDLGGASELDHVEHIGPSYLDTMTLAANPSLPRSFLEGCGLSEFDIVAYDLRRSDIAADEDAVHRLIYRLDAIVSQGPLVIGGAFISYARSDGAAFTDRLCDAFSLKKLRHWRDVKDLKSGPTAPQLTRAVRLHDVTILILSEAAFKSDWIALEIETARSKEHELGRCVLCPIALDDSWEEPGVATGLGQPLIGYLKRTYNIISFEGWEDAAVFERQFAKLWEGLEENYRIRGER